MKRSFDQHTVEISNESKCLYPESGITKGDVLDYYDDLETLMRPHLDHRCLALQRYPDGIHNDGFFQQHRPDHFPDYVACERLPTADDDDTINHIIADNKAALIYLADQAALALHGWLSTTDQPQRPDRVIFDLDPRSAKDFDAVIPCARSLRQRLEDAGLCAFVMTTGSRGLHVLAPLDRSLDFDEVRELADAIATATAREEPDHFTVEQRKASRDGEVYIDVSRNAYGQTSVLPYSLRALEGAPVATPLDWDELGRNDLCPDRFSLTNVRARLGQKDDPLHNFRARAARPASGIVESATVEDDR